MKWKLWISKRILCTCAVFAAVLHTLIVQCSGQTMCDETLTVSSFSENPIQDDVRTCIQCVIGGSVSTTATWLIGTTPGAAATTPISSSDGEVVNGVLVIFDPSTIIPGLGFENSIRVSCSAGGSSLNFFIGLDAFLPPVVYDVTVNETDRLTLTCVNSNAGLSTSVQWLNSQGEVLANSPTLSVQNVKRNYTGVYTCVLTRIDTMKTMSSDASVIVQYAPEVTTQNADEKFSVTLGGQLTLSCDFDGVPTPVIEWLHNGSLLSDSDPHISITTDVNSSLLELSNLQRDSGGQYVCLGTNVVGVGDIIKRITIIVPPSPATNLRIVSTTESEVTLAWSNGFDGFSPITGIQIEIFVGEQFVDTRDLSGNSTLESSIIRLLSPSINYTFVLRVRNDIGLSDPVSVTRNTPRLLLDNITELNIAAIVLGVIVGLLILVILIGLVAMVIITYIFWRQQSRLTSLTTANKNQNNVAVTANTSYASNKLVQESEYENAKIENKVYEIPVKPHPPPAETHFDIHTNVSYGQAQSQHRPGTSTIYHYVAI